jgi:hypothetical protein
VGEAIIKREKLSARRESTSWQHRSQKQSSSRHAFLANESATPKTNYYDHYC